MKNLLMVFLLCGLAGFAYSAEPHFRVCSLPLAPQTMPDAEGQPSGYAVEILQHVASNLGWSISIEYMPWPRVDLDAQQGKCDMVMTVLYFDDYARYMRFPKEAILDQRNVLVVRRDSHIAYDGNLETFMHQNRIGVYADKRVNEQFEVLRRAPWARVETVHRWDMNLEKLLHKRLDVVIENDLSTIYELSKLGRVDEVEILSPPLSITPAYITFSMRPEAEQYSQLYDVELARFKKTAAFKALTEKYLGVQGRSGAHRVAS